MFLDTYIRLAETVEKPKTHFTNTECRDVWEERKISCLGQESNPGFLEPVACLPYRPKSPD